MRRKWLIVLLTLGTIGGFTFGALRLAHYRHHGPHGWSGRDVFRERIAETCTEAALKVYEKKAGAKPAGPRD